ncbi:PREDICTED: ribosome biogenesis protein BRX1 homolog [Galeopterus variegatus]|uniref:Ribosome biogenesis protein BRX1 homolog n=1 Tax=Galeopterus variegatus TaxID=482537 RepID=A0ABM0SJ77_GALVR|nr:PREDICTED: ribosome biogenesis protein BRX1 homolog [Galeopterus variegatus]
MAATKRKRRGGSAVQAKKPKRNGKDAGPSAKPRVMVEEVEEEERDRIPGPVCKGKWINKERILIFSSRGINFRTRHLMQDLRMLMPHSKADTKMDRKDKLFVINEVILERNSQKIHKHRRIIRSITAAKYREKQQVKDVQKLRKKEPKTILPHDPTEDVFAIPAEEKPIEIQWVKPEPKVDLKARKKRIYKRQRKMKQKMGARNAK